MPRRGGTWIGWPAAGLALLLGAGAASGGLGALAGSTTPGHGAHIRNTIQGRLPSRPGVGGTKGKYTPGVCHPNTEEPASDGQIDQWITQAGVLLHRPYSATERRIVHIAINHESGGKVHAINCWDRNYTDLHTPSMGLMQAIAPTYAAHAPAACRPRGPPGIYDPPCNIAACTHYAIGRYGSIEAIPGIRSVQAGDDYIGY